MGTQRGFTLIELMVALAVVAITVSYGVPRITGLLQNNRNVAQVNNLSANLHYARSEAVKRAGNVNIIANNATDKTKWEDGWTIYVDNNNSNTVDAGEALRIESALNIPNVTITGPADNITFAGDGSSGVERTLTMTDSKTSTTYTIKISATGNIKIYK